MEVVDAAAVRRHERVDLPLLVSFSSEAYAVRQFTLDLSEGGIFLPTDRSCPVGTRGRLKFRASHFDEPFTVEAEVVRTVEPGQERAAGLGMQFVELTDKQRTLLQKLVTGTANGSIVQAIRSGLKENARSLGAELRKRPTDQKMMLALQANAEEIQFLIRDANPSVLARLLDCPRLTTAHVITMLRNPNLPTRVLSAVKKDRKWISNQAIRYLFCAHPNSLLAEAVDQLRSLPPDRLRAVARDARCRAPIRAKAQELVKRCGRG